MQIQEPSSLRCNGGIWQRTTPHCRSWPPHLECLMPGGGAAVRMYRQHVPTSGMDRSGPVHLLIMALSSPGTCPAEASWHLLSSLRHLQLLPHVHEGKSFFPFPELTSTTSIFFGDKDNNGTRDMGQENPSLSFSCPMSLVPLLSLSPKKLENVSAL